MNETPTLSAAAPQPLTSDPVTVKLNGVMNELSLVISTLTAAHRHELVHHLKKAANHIHEVQRMLQR